MRKTPLFRLFTYMNPHHKTILFASICSILNQFFDIFPEVLLGMAVDVVVNKQGSFIGNLGFPDMLTQLAILGALSLITWTFESIFQYLYNVLWRNLAQTVQHQMRIDAYAHIQKLEMAYFEEKSTGELLSILNDDVNQLERFLDNGVNLMLQLITSTLVTGAIFFYTSPTIALFTLAPTPFILILSFIFQHRLSFLYTGVRKQAGLLGSRLANNIMGIATIKSYTTEQYEIKRLSESSKNYKRACLHSITVSAAFRPIIRMAIVLGFVATIVVGGWYAIKGYIPIGAYSTLVFLTQRLLWPFTDLADMVNDYERGMASIRRILNLIETPICINNGTVILPAEKIVGDISFHNILFTYPSGFSIFNNLTLNIPAGKTTAFVGQTGSGKSSIIKLLLRFYDPISGSITLDNTNIKELTLTSLRKAISFVGQDAFLFHGTIHDNIMYGSPNASIETVIQAAKLAGAHEFIEQLPHGYYSIVGERGQKLSGGQRQRISIARAIVKNAPIFIFDEATSAVDNETEAAIQRSLEQIAHGHTTIIIAHRLSTIRHADIIHVLSSGSIVESGNHQELIALNGIYNTLWNIQTGQH